MKTLCAVLMLAAMAAGETKVSASFDKEHPGYLRVCWDDVCTVAKEVTWTMEDCRSTDDFVVADPPEPPIMTKYLPNFTIDSPKWKPLLVPAVEHGYWAIGYPHNVWVPQYSCADKARILEHDQQDPPKYWCRAEMQ